MTTAAVIIIGNEILTGKFSDQNGPYAIAQLRERGIDLLRLTTLRDEVEAIATEVRVCIDLADRVITSGGVGPTHDDVTFAGVAQALGVPLVLSEPLMGWIHSHGMSPNQASRQMALVPQGATLIQGAAHHYPVVRCGKVYVLPGVPRLFKRKLDTVLDPLPARPLYLSRLKTLATETQIAATLREVNQAFPSVEIGSYPQLQDNIPWVLITLEGREQAPLQAAERSLLQSTHGFVTA